MTPTFGQNTDDDDNYVINNENYKSLTDFHVLNNLRCEWNVDVTGETINATGYTKWAGGQPDGATNEDCLVIGFESQLHDVPCSSPATYMCEIGI